MEKQRVLITVKTYPTLSRKYGETVCTAGLREDGTWVRMYPVPFRRLNEEEQYRKYDWVECGLIRNHSDPRPETFRPADPNELVAVGHIGTERDWEERRGILLKKAKANAASLAVFKPTKILDFTWEAEEREWDPKKLQDMRDTQGQLDLFEDNAWRKTFQIIPKLPYSFSYKFEDAAGRRSELQVLDWEAGALYWNCLRRNDGNEARALAQARQKYLDEFATKDLHFFLGTTQQFHFVAPNPWVIIGVLPIPHQAQEGLFDSL